jgi:hypothetical protein
LPGRSTTELWPKPAAATPRGAYGLQASAVRSDFRRGCRSAPERLGDHRGDHQGCSQVWSFTTATGSGCSASRTPRRRQSAVE